MIKIRFLYPFVQEFFNKVDEVGYVSIVKGSLTNATNSGAKLYF